MKRDTNALDQALQSLFEKRGYPGIAVTIRGPEGILFEKGYGYRDVEHQLPADTHTIFGIASMSKSITALCCAILATEGKLSLEDPITKYFPTLHIPGIPDECVTLRKCLRCTGPAFHRWSLWNGRLRKTAGNAMTTGSGGWLRKRQIRWIRSDRS